MKQYHQMVKYVLKNGTTKENRTGIDTISHFNYNYKVNLQDGFPLLTTKKINWYNILFETLWFLSGNNKVEWLHKHNIHFWDAWIEDGEYLPEAYGEFWRRYPNFQWDGDEVTDKYNTEYSDVGFDQFEAIVNGLKNDPNNRRLVLTNWYPPSAWEAKLPPCHLMSIFNTQYDKDGEPNLNLHMTQRSCDIAVGVPFNIASYALLLSIVGHLVDIPVKFFAHTLVDAHIYENHLDGLQEQLNREPQKLPSFQIDSSINSLENLDNLIRNGYTSDIVDCFRLEDYNPQPFIKFEVAV